MTSKAEIARIAAIKKRLATKGTSTKQGDLYAALDDAESGLDICSRCDYKWAESDAHIVLRDIWKTLGNREKEEHHGSVATALLSSLRPN